MERPDDDELIRYLLGNLPEDRCVRIEQLYFEDEELFERLLALEGVLAESYALGKLSTDDAQRFAVKFLHLPQVQREISFVRAVAAYVEQVSVKKTGATLSRVRSWLKSVVVELASLRPLYKLSFALAVVVGIASVVLVARLSLIKHEHQKLEAERLTLKEELASRQLQSDSLAQRLKAEQVKREALELDLAAREMKGTPRVLSFILMPGSLRDGSPTQTIKLPKVDVLIMLQLELEGEVGRENYDAVLYDENSEVVKHWDGVQSVRGANGLQLSLSLQSRLFEARRYRIELDGKKELVFLFRVVGR